MTAKNITDLFDIKLTIEFNQPAMKERFPHRRGAENAEASQREEEKEEEKREGVKKLSISLLLSARPRRSLRLCGERGFQSSTKTSNNPKTQYLWQNQKKLRRNYAASAG